MLRMRPELSVAEGLDHVTCVEIVPLSAVATIFDGQFENTGAETSVNEKNLSLTKKTRKYNIHKFLVES